VHVHAGEAAAASAALQVHQAQGHGAAAARSSIDAADDRTFIRPMQAVRGGRDPLIMLALVTLAVGGAQLFHRPAAPRNVETIGVVRVQPRSVPADRVDRVVPARVPVEPVPVRCCFCVMHDNEERAAKELALLKAKRRAASRSRR